MTGRTVVHIGKHKTSTSRSTPRGRNSQIRISLTIKLNTVLFKFKPDVSIAHRETFAQELRTLRKLPSVLNERLIVGGPSITDPIERSKGCHFALLSFHENQEALAEYQASDEHHRYVAIG
jgi:hypothetical protein